MTIILKIRHLRNLFWESPHPLVGRSWARGGVLPPKETAKKRSGCRADDSCEKKRADGPSVVKAKRARGCVERPTDGLLAAKAKNGGPQGQHPSSASQSRLQNLKGRGPMDRKLIESTKTRRTQMLLTLTRIRPKFGIHFDEFDEIDSGAQRPSQCN